MLFTVGFKKKVSYPWLDGKAAQQKTNKKRSADEGDGEDGVNEEQQENEEEEEEEDEEEKVIFIHYEQRKVMLSQLHPFEVPDSETDLPSELRQVGEKSQDPSSFLIQP